MTVALLHLEAHILNRAQAAEVSAQMLNPQQRFSRVHLFGLDRLTGERLAYIEHSDRLAATFHRRLLRLFAATKTFPQA